MDLASAYYLGTTVAMFAVLLAIALRTYRKKNRLRGEAPKYRMMDED